MKDVVFTYLANNYDLELLILVVAYKVRKELKHGLRYVLIESIKTDGSASNILTEVFLMVISLLNCPKKRHLVFF